MRAKVVVAFMFGAVSLPALAQSPRTIVGEWAPERGDCGTPQAIKVFAKSLAADEMMCEFTNVARKGDVVTFEGTCDSGTASGPEPETLTARLSPSGKLNLVFSKGGGRIAGLLRCPRKPPS